MTAWFLVIYLFSQPEAHTAIGPFPSRAVCEKAQLKPDGPGFLGTADACVEMPLLPEDG